MKPSWAREKSRRFLSAHCILSEVPWLVTVSCWCGTVYQDQCPVRAYRDESVCEYDLRAPTRGSQGWGWVPDPRSQIPKVKYLSKNVVCKFQGCAPEGKWDRVAGTKWKGNNISHGPCQDPMSLQRHPLRSLSTFQCQRGLFLRSLNSGFMV